MWSSPRILFQRANTIWRRFCPSSCLVGVFLCLAPLPAKPFSRAILKIRQFVFLVYRVYTTDTWRVSNEPVHHHCTAGGGPVGFRVKGSTRGSCASQNYPLDFVTPNSTCTETAPIRFRTQLPDGKSHESACRLYREEVEGYSSGGCGAIGVRRFYSRRHASRQFQ